MIWSNSANTSYSLFQPNDNITIDAVKATQKGIMWFKKEVNTDVISAVYLCGREKGKHVL